MRRGDFISAADLARAVLKDIGERKVLLADKMAAGIEKPTEYFKHVGMHKEVTRMETRIVEILKSLEKQADVEDSN